jgi:hypothetical protein
VHLGHRRRRGLEAVAAVDEDDALGLVRAFGREVQRPVQRGVAAADDHQVLAREVGRVLHPVEQLRAVELVEAVDLQQARLEGADAGGDEDGLGQELRAARGLDPEAAVVLLLDHGDGLAQVEGGAERLDLLEQRVGQLLPGAHRDGRDVVDRLVGIQLDRLAAG